MNVNCPICHHGSTRAGTATVTLERGDMTLVVRNVPADVCENCGEEFISEEVTRELLQQAEAALEAGVQVEVRSFRAA